MSKIRAVSADCHTLGSKYLSYILTLNLIRKLYIPFVLKAFQEIESIEDTVQQSGVRRIIPKKKTI